METPVTYGYRRVRRTVTRPTGRLALVGLSILSLLVVGATGQPAFAAQIPTTATKVHRAALVPDPASMVNTMVQTGSGGNDFAASLTKTRLVYSVSRPSTRSRKALLPVWLGATPCPL